MSKVEELTLVDFAKWLNKLDTLDLIEAEATVREARERKKNEGRISLIRVQADGMCVAHFMAGDMKGVLEYLSAHVDELSDLDGMIRTDMVKVPESEVVDLITNRWW